MSNLIKDGTGSGNFAKVDANNQLLVQAESLDIIHSKALFGESYSMSSEIFSLTTSTTGKLTYIQLDETVNQFALQNYRFFWDGGSTNYNKTLQINFFLGNVAPSVNVANGNVSNTNFNSSKTLLSTIKYWDGVGVGMTGDVSIPIGSIFVSPGATVLEYQGMWVLTPGAKLAFSATAPEDGKFSMSITGFTVDPTQV